MKTKLLTSIATIALAMPAFSATYIMDMSSGENANGVQDTLGRAFRNNSPAGTAFLGAAGGTSAGPGVLAVGIFSTDALSGINTMTDLVSRFTNFGNVTNTFASGGGAGARGTFSISTTAPVTGSTFENKNIYFFAGNGATFLGSSEVLVFKSSTKFLAAHDNSVPFEGVTMGFGGALKNEALAGEVLFGSTVADMKTTSADATVTPGFRMAPVPEPSAALLGAFGALALLRRRRNQS